MESLLWVDSSVRLQLWSCGYQPTVLTLSYDQKLSTGSECRGMVEQDYPALSPSLISGGCLLPCPFPQGQSLQQFKSIPPTPLWLGAVCNSLWPHVPLYHLCAFSKLSDQVCVSWNLFSAWELSDAWCSVREVDRGAWTQQSLGTNEKVLTQTSSLSVFSVWWIGSCMSTEHYDIWKAGWWAARHRTLREQLEYKWKCAHHSGTPQYLFSTPRSFQLKTLHTSFCSKDSSIPTQLLPSD